MATLTELRQGLAQAWGQVVEGWRSLTSRAAGAITRFTSSGREPEERWQDRTADQSVGWGVLAAELWEDQDRILVRLEAPGMKKSDFVIEIEEDFLVVRGEKRISREERQGRCHVLECAYGVFERAIPLPAPVDRAKARARYRRGVLLVELPMRAASSGTRRIPIG